MMDDLSFLHTFDGVTRLFPLPNVVLFPLVTLPLHIFEPRYRQMTADALAGDRLITMILLKPGYEAQYLNQPPLHSVACLGKIIADQLLEDGRYNILLRGVSRVRILSELASDRLYRTARVQLLEDRASACAQTEVIQDKLARHVASWLASHGPALDQTMKLIKSDLPLGVLSDILGFALPLGVEFKQELLEDQDVDSRLRRLLTFLEANEPPGGKKSLDQPFPPDFSAN